MVLEVADDGYGVDVDAVVRKAQQGGMSVPTVSVIMAMGSALAAVTLLFLKLDKAPPEAVQAEPARSAAGAGRLEGSPAPG